MSWFINAFWLDCEMNLYVFFSFRIWHKLFVPFAFGRIHCTPFSDRRLFVLSLTLVCENKVNTLLAGLLDKFFHYMVVIDIFLILSQIQFRNGFLIDFFRPCKAYPFLWEHWDSSYHHFTALKFAWLLIFGKLYFAFRDDQFIVGHGQSTLILWWKQSAIHFHWRYWRLNHESHMWIYFSILHVEYLYLFIFDESLKW